MKRAICILAGALVFFQVYSQQEPAKLLRLEVGPCMHFNSLNEDNYLSYMSDFSAQNTSMAGIDLRFSSSFKPGLDLIFGALAEVGLDYRTNPGWNPGSTNSSDYVLNGGGVYVGLNPHTRGKYFGLDADIAAGVLAYKEYRVEFNNVVQPYVDKYDKKSSFLGGMASLGFYLRTNTIGISPEFQVVMAGGSNGSFLFYGVNVPLTISF